MTYTEKELIKSIKKALCEKSRKYSTAQERNLISIFYQAIAEDRKMVLMGMIQKFRPTIELDEVL